MRITITNPVWLTTIILSLELHIPRYRVRMSGFIKRCWKCVINFGLQWSLQNIAKLKSSIEHVLSVHCNKRGAEIVKARKNTKVFWLILSTKIENIWKQYLTKNLNHQHFVHFHTSSSLTSPHNGIPRPHEVSPPISSSEATAPIVLCIHGRLRLQEPLDHGIMAHGSCLVQRCFASGAAARGQATGRTPRNEGEKNSENILGSKVKVSEILATHKSSLNLRNDVVLRMFWWHRIGWKRPCEPGWQSKCFEET